MVPSAVRILAVSALATVAVAAAAATTATGDIDAGSAAPAFTTRLALAIGIPAPQGHLMRLAQMGQQRGAAAAQSGGASRGSSAMGTQRAPAARTQRPGSFTERLVPEAVKAAAQPINRTWRGVTFGVEGYSSKYEVPNTYTQDGKIESLSLGYTYDLGDTWLKFQGRYGRGDVDYSASNGTGQKAGIDDQTYEYRVLYGRDLVRGNVGIAPFIGYGFRRHEEERSGSQTTAGTEGYDRRSHWHYATLGASLYIPIAGGDWRFAPTFEFNYLFSGEQRSELDRTSAGCPAIDAKQTRGKGWELAAMFETLIEGQNLLSVGPFYRRWDIDRSDVTAVTCSNAGTSIMGPYSASSTSFAEPTNSTTEFGFRLTVGF